MIKNKFILISNYLLMVWLLFYGARYALPWLLDWWGEVYISIVSPALWIMALLFWLAGTVKVRSGCFTDSWWYFNLFFLLVVKVSL